MPTIQIYTSGYCPYCVRAKALLDKKKVAYEEIRVDLNEEKQEEMIAKSQRRTVPQIFIGDVHIGGCDDLYDLERQGKLNQLLNI